MNWKNLEGASIADNPCWGGPEPHRHDLQYLLRVLGGSRSKLNSTEHITEDPISASSYAALMDRVISRLIIYNDDNYIAIHKPADLRMDGPHRATVHKLLLYLYPPPSMLQKTTDQDNAANETSQRRHEHLLESIAPLTNTSDLKDDPFRTVHQLDYATSGVLLMGKNRKAAGAACISFQERRAKKTYVAVITANGNSNELPFGKDFVESMPILPESSLKPWAAGSLEKQYRKKRRRDTDGKGTFNGYMPEHAIFAKWRGYMIKKKKAGGVDANKRDGKLDASSKNGKQANQDDVMSQLIQSTTQQLTPQAIDDLLSIGPSWKKVKTHCDNSAKDDICSWPSTIERMTKEYNQSTAAATAATTEDEKTTNQPDNKAKGNDDETKQPGSSTFALPPLFRIQNEECDSFYICASIGEVGDGRFDVLVDPSAALPSTQPNTPSALPEMKPSLTRCTVLWRGYVHDATTSSTAKEEGRVPVAKVVLSPWTGRRHQLRVHLSRVAGCPILGDVAYTGTDDRGAVGSRMCLHAKELVIPLIGGQAHTFTAKDPFVIDNDSIQIDNFC
eukprot:scaffold2282_cov77-Skeletonema_dohrnii-CCMP3373.AAC.11